MYEKPLEKLKVDFFLVRGRVSFPCRRLDLDKVYLRLKDLSYELKYTDKSLTLAALRPYTRESLGFSLVVYRTGTGLCCCDLNKAEELQDWLFGLWSNHFVYCVR